MNWCDEGGVHQGVAAEGVVQLARTSHGLTTAVTETTMTSNADSFEEKKELLKRVLEYHRV